MDQRYKGDHPKGNHPSALGWRPPGWGIRDS